LARLGIDAVDLGDPSRVLGLPPDCRDAALIARAAEMRLESLGRVTPGPFAKAHAVLVTRVEEARDSLLAAVFSGGVSAPPAQPRPTFTPPPPPAGASASRWAGVGDASTAAPTGFPAPSDEVEPMLGPSLRTPAARGRSSSSGAGGLLLTSFALLAAAVAVLVFLMLRPDPFGGQVAVKKPASTTPPPATNGAKPAGGAGATRLSQPATPRPPEMPTPAPAPVPPPAAPPPAATVDPSDRGAEPGVPRRPERKVEQRPSGGEMQESEAEKPMLQQREGERLRLEKEEQARRDAEMAEQKAVAAAREAEEPRRKTEMAEPAGTQEADQERARMQEALDKSLGDAFKALQRGEFDTADRTIKAAESHVGDDVEAATRIERWRLLATYAREFVGFREQAITAANAGREFQVDGKPFAVVEITPDMFIYKLAGKMERVPRERVDPRIELAVVEGWFEADGRAANHLFLGARWLCLDPPNPSRARAEWRIAGDGGEQVGPLNALLEDPVIRRAGR
jgi:hypothetical protein